MKAVLHFLLLLAAPVPVSAHELIGQHGALLGPALHVFTQIDHLAAFLAAGMLAGQSGAPARTLAVRAFLGVLALGLVLPVALPALDALAAIEALLSSGTVLVTGILIAASPRLPAWQIAAVSAASAAIHGFANGLSIANSPRLAVSMLGALLAVCIIYVCGLGAAVALQGPRGRIVVRVLGSWIAALSLMLIGLAVRR